MKKILSILLAIMMMASLFAGCSSEEETPVQDEPVHENEIVVQSLNKTITAVVYDRGDDEAYWREIKTAFESANAGVTVNLIVTKDAAYEVRERILGGNSPDFVFLPSSEESGVTEALIKDRAMMPLEDIQYAPAGIFENSICKPYSDGKTYIAPVFFETKGLIYNTELLSSNGFSVPETWDDFVAIAEACKNKNFEFFTYAGAQPDEFADIFVAALVSEIGTEEMNKILGGEEEAWKNEKIGTFIEKLEKVTKLVVAGSSTKTKADTVELLKNGKVLFVSGTEADLKELNKDGEKYAICAYPTLSGEQTGIVTFSEMYIPIEAKEPELAKAFMAEIYKKEAASSYFENAFYTEFAVSEDGENLSDEFCKLIVDVFKGNANSKNFAEKMIEYIK